MARIRSILGDIEGSAGTITFTKQAGVNLLRQKVGRNASRSTRQVAQRSRFSEIGRLARSIGALLLVGYRRQGFLSGYNRFVQANIPFVSLDQDLVASIDYARVRVSSGSLLPLVGLAVADGAGGKRVTWADNSNGTDALASDKVYVAVVNTAAGQSAESLGTATRGSGSVLVTASFLAGLPAAQTAVYAFAVRTSDNEPSESVSLATAQTPAPSFDTTLVMGTNNEAAGVTLAASVGDTLRFNALTVGGAAPTSMDLGIGGQQVASVAYLDRYNGRPFSFTTGGRTYRGTFQPTVDF